MNNLVDGSKQKYEKLYEEFMEKLEEHQEWYSIIEKQLEFRSKGVEIAVKIKNMQGNSN